MHDCGEGGERLWIICSNTTVVETKLLVRPSWREGVERELTMMQVGHGERLSLVGVYDKECVDEHE